MKIQVFHNIGGEIKYAKAMQYRGRQNGKPQFDYHQQYLEYIQRKLNQIPKDVNHQIVDQLGQIKNGNIDGAQSSTILKKSWASSSERIEHPPWGVVIFYYFLYSY
jgi:hypothetical protein